MEVVELKFLLALLGHPPNYHTALSALRPTESRSDRNRACRQLSDRNLVRCSEEIIQFKTSTSGKALLKLVSDSSDDGANGQTSAQKKGKKTGQKSGKTSAKKSQEQSQEQSQKHASSADELPITRDDIRLLNAGMDDWITPGKAMKGVAPQKRQTLLQALETRGLIQAETQVKEVWLTSAGRDFLINDCHPDGNHTVSFNFLRNYINFMRGAIQGASQDKPGHSSTPHPTGNTIASLPYWTASTKPEVADVAAMAQRLDQELGTQNYLPLFYLRQAFQASLSRDELDQALYDLQRHDKIELSSLQDAIAYTPGQVQAGIPQDIGGPLFFVSLCL